MKFSYFIIFVLDFSWKLKYTNNNIASCAIWLRWAGQVARMEEGRNAFKILTGTPTGKRPLGREGVDERTILEWILKK